MEGATEAPILPALNIFGISRKRKITTLLLLPYKSIFTYSTFFMHTLDRRSFLMSSLAMACAPYSAFSEEPSSAWRGVILSPEDFTLSDWPERARRAGLNVIGIHSSLRGLSEFVQSDKGKDVLSRCANEGIAVEFPAHAFSELLPRDLFSKAPDLFRFDSNRRNADANCCPSNPKTLEIMAENAIRLAKILTPTSHRYYFWQDDFSSPWCSCEKCKDYSASDQLLFTENHLIKALRTIDPKATLAHIAYARSLPAPVKVTPEQGVFLEFAPIQRIYDYSIGERGGRTRSKGGEGKDPDTNGGYLDILEENLKVFGSNTAQATEYWLDVSMFSSWRKPAKKLPWKGDVCASDIKCYRSFGIKNFTTFGVFIDQNYVNAHGDIQSLLEEYGSYLK